MAHIYSEEAVVRIWRNVKRFGKIPTGHFGHAAVTVRGSTGSAYISFWPGINANIGKSAIRKQPSHASDSYAKDKVSEMNRLTALRLEVGYRQQHGIPIPPEWIEVLNAFNKTPLNNPRPGQTRLGVNERITDAAGDDWEFPLWSQSPENKINIPGIGASTSFWGVSLRRMAQWWNQFKATQPQYQALSRKNNCAGVALLGLKAGGSEAYVKLPSVTVYAEPLQVENYANALLAKIQDLNRITQDVDNDVRAVVASKALSPTPASEIQDGIYTLQHWKQRSHLGGLTVRSGTIRDIDSAVEKFHTANWHAAFPDRLKALVDIMTAIAKHRAEKPDSKRSEAIVRLAAQVITVLRNPGPIR